jgi:hypothetical protein
MFPTCCFQLLCTVVLFKKNCFQMKHVSCLFDFQLICLIVLNKSGLNLTLKQNALDVEQHIVWKARIHLELGVVLGICPPAIGPLNLRLAMGIRVLLLILQLRAVCTLPFFSKDKPVLLKNTRVDSSAHI